MKKNQGNKYWTNPYVAYNIYPKLVKVLTKFLEPGWKILDAGCGIGNLAKFLPSYYKLYGCDIQKSALAEAKQLKKYEKIIYADLNKKLPFKDCEYDAAVSVEVFDYLSDPWFSLRELARVVKYRVIVVVPNYNWLKFFYGSHKLPKYTKHTLDFNVNFLINLGKTCDLNIEKIFYISNKFERFRNLFGNWLASNVGIVYKK